MGHVFCSPLMCLYPEVEFWKKHFRHGSGRHSHSRFVALPQKSNSFLDTVSTGSGSDLVTMGFPVLTVSKREVRLLRRSLFG